MKEKRLFLTLKKIVHESENVEFKEYFKVKGDLWRETTDKIAAYLAGLGNAGGGILFLGIPVNAKGNFDEKRWNTEKPIEEINYDRICQLLQNKIPKKFYNDLKIKLITSEIHKGYCRIVIIVPPQYGLIYLEFKNLELRRELKNRNINIELNNLTPIFIPLKTKTSLKNYPLKDYIIKSSPFLSKKSISTFSDKLQLLKVHIDQVIKIERLISIEDVKIFCLEVTKIAKNNKECINLVSKLLEDQEYIIQYPVTESLSLNDDENETTKQNYHFDSGIEAQCKIEFYFENTTDFFIASRHSKEYEEYGKKYREDPDHFELSI